MQFRNSARLSAVAAMLLVFSILASAAIAQGSAKLAISVTPLGAAAGEKPVPVAATASVNVTLKNESSEPIANVLLTAALNGVKLAPENEWKADGENAVIEIASIKAGEEITRRLNLVVPFAPMPPGRVASVSVDAKIGEAKTSASTKFQIADCAASFQADLARLRMTSISEIWPTADDMRKPDTSLPRTRYFRVAMRRNNELAIIDRLAAGYQARLLSQYDFFQEGVRYTARRWSDELKAFTNQEPNPGVCAVNDEMVQGIRKTINYVTARIEPPMRAYARAMEQLRKAVSAEDGDDLQKIALRVAAEAGAKIENPAGNIFKILEQARDLLKDRKPTDAQLDNLSLIESVAWVEAQANRSKKLNDLIENSITGITDAQKKNCVCAF